MITTRAYPDSEFVVANTLAKWKKLEPNEIDFRQGFSQKVISRSCSVFNSLLASGDFCRLMITYSQIKRVYDLYAMPDILTSM